ncbi:MAG: ATP-binding protein [Verrucomicrobiota bacterium]
MIGKLIQQQLDYLQLDESVAGLAVALLGLLLYRRFPARRWGGMAFFGAGLLAAGLFGLLTPVVSPVIIPAGHALLEAVTFLALTVFGCRQWQAERKPLRVDKWLPWFLLLPGLSGLVLGVPQLEVTLHYFLELPASLLAARALWRLAGREKSLLRHGLTLAAAALVGFALADLSGMVGTVSTAAAVPDRFWLDLRLVAKLLQAFCLMIFAVGLWFFYRIGRSRPTLGGDGWGWFTPLVMLTLLGLGWRVTEWRGRSLEEVMRAHLQIQTTQMAHSIDPKLAGQLPFAATDRTNVAYVSIREQMIAYGRIIHHRSIYSVALRNGELKFGPENLAVNDPAASPPGTIYLEPPPGLRSVFATGVPLTAGPYRDEYGSYVSCFAPVLNPRDGSVILVVGLDLLADDWQNRVASQRLKPMLLTLVMLFVIMTGLAIRELLDRSQLNGKRKSSYLETAIVGLTGMAFTAIIGLVVFANATNDRWLAFEQLAGVQAEKMRGVMQSIQADLVGLATVVQTRPTLGAGEFATIAGRLTARAGIRSVQWISREPTGAKEAFSVRLVEPPEGEPLAPGSAAGVNFALQAAITSSFRLRLPITTVIAAMPTNSCSGAEAVLICPVYGDDPTELRGFIAGFIDVDRVLRLVTTHAQPDESDISMMVADLGGRNGAEVIAQYPPGKSPLEVAQLDLLRSDQGAVKEFFPVFLPGRTWAMASWPDANFRGGHPDRFTAMTLLGGSAFTATIMILVGLARRRQDELEVKVSERTQALREAKEAAEAANKSKSEFLTTISHEIRTPMNGLLGMTELLQKTRMDASQRDLLQHAATSGRTLLGIINEILDFSKIESGQLQLEVTDFALRPLVQEVIGAIAGADPAKPVKISLAWDAAVPAAYHGDANRLRQLFQILVGNAFKFTPSGTITVSLTCTPPQDQRTTLHVEVADTGIGISEAKQKLLFQPFQQVDSSDARRFGGTGLGLAICRRLLELMGGSIGVKSHEGRGSTFWFELTLPVAEEMNFASLRVLVAEDHPINQRLALLALGKLGCAAAAVGTGSELLARVRSGKWDVVLLSPQMPDMSLEKILRELDAFGKASAISIVGLVTGEASPGLDVFQAVGVKVCLARPFSIWQLREAITEAYKSVKAARLPP